MALSPKATILDALEASFVAANDYHRATRALRNRIVVMTTFALLTSAAIVILQWRLPGVSFVTSPTDALSISKWKLLLLVMAFGAVGGLLTAIPPVTRLPPSGSPFNFPLQQAFLKIALAPLTALIGVIVIGGASNLTSDIKSLPALLAAAVVFGAAQQGVTRYLDQRATSLIESGPKNPERP